MNSKGSIINRILGYSVASWVNCIITFISTPIITTFFSPDELGKVNLFVAYANVAIPFVYLGFDQAFARFYYEKLEKNDSYSLAKMCIYISGVMFILTSLVLLIMSEYLSKKIVGYGNFVITTSLIVYVFSSYITRYTQLDARMKNNVLLYSIQTIVITVIIKVSFIVVVIVKPLAEYAIIFRSGSFLIATLIFIVIFIKNGSGHKVVFSYKALVELTKYSIPLFPTAFMVTLNASLPQVLLSKYESYSSIGIYTNALTITSIITLLQSGLNTFWAPFVYESYKTEQVKLQKMQHVISYSMFAFGFLMILFQTPIYIILVNSKYWASKEIFALLTISPVCITISETLGIGIDLSKKTYLKIPVYIISIIANYALCIILIPVYGVLGASIASGISAIIMMLAKTFCGEKYFKCCDNYLKLFLGMLLFVIACFVNALVTGIQKYLLVLSLFALCTIIYRTEVKKIYYGAIDYIFKREK